MLRSPSRSSTSYHVCRCWDSGLLLCTRDSNGLSFRRAQSLILRCQPDRRSHGHTRMQRNTTNREVVSHDWEPLSVASGARPARCDAARQPSPCSLVCTREQLRPLHYCSLQPWRARAYALPACPALGSPRLSLSAHFLQRQRGVQGASADDRHFSPCQRAHRQPPPSAARITEGDERGEGEAHRQRLQRRRLTLSVHPAGQHQHERRTRWRPQLEGLAMRSVCCCSATRPRCCATRYSTMTSAQPQQSAPQPPPARHKPLDTTHLPQRGSVRRCHRHPCQRRSRWPVCSCT